LYQLAPKNGHQICILGKWLSILAHSNPYSKTNALQPGIRSYDSVLSLQKSYERKQIPVCEFNGMFLVAVARLVRLIAVFQRRRNPSPLDEVGAIHELPLQGYPRRLRRTNRRSPGPIFWKYERGIPKGRIPFERGLGVYPQFFKKLPPRLVGNG